MQPAALDGSGVPVGDWLHHPCGQQEMEAMFPDLLRRFGAGGFYHIFAYPPVDQAPLLDDGIFWEH